MPPQTHVAAGLPVSAQGTRTVHTLACMLTRATYTSTVCEYNSTGHRGKESLGGPGSAAAPGWRQSERCRDTVEPHCTRGDEDDRKVSSDTCRKTEGTPLNGHLLRAKLGAKHGSFAASAPLMSSCQLCDDCQPQPYPRAAQKAPLARSVLLDEAQGPAGSSGEGVHITQHQSCVAHPRGLRAAVMALPKGTITAIIADFNGPVIPTGPATLGARGLC
ncbi:hypothetical protein TREES_T100004320 [Tupaia chinensis]|uniref:Uncharacterized protein n=1 Tax=Tupaia chinensis TaxID=246437 RepID=L9KHT2_TUPCH|nr:hypothetical protein TREES_T100004320 [Tupaia chinensis]